MRRPLAGLALVIGLMTLIAGARYYSRIHRFWGITQTDFSVFYQAGYQIDRRASMYEQHPTHYTTDKEYLFKYPPPFGFAMIPWSRLPIQVAIRWWYGLTAVALLGALWGIRRLVDPSLQDGRFMVIAGMALLAVLRPFLANLRLGQIDVVLAGCLIGFLVAHRRRRDAAAGWWLGIPILCKLVPAVWLAYLAAARRWRALGWTLLAILTYLASPIPHLGFAGTRGAVMEWLGTLHASGGNHEWLLRYKNQSVLSAALRVIAGPQAETVTGGQLAAAMGVTAGFALLYGGWVWRAMRISRETDDPLCALVAPSLVMIAMVIFSPHAWIATFIHLLLPYAVLGAYLVTRAPDDRLGWGLFLGSVLLVSATAPDLLGAASRAAHIASAVMWGAVCLAIGVRRIGRGNVRAGR